MLRCVSLQCLVCVCLLCVCVSEQPTLALALTPATTKKTATTIMRSAVVAAVLLLAACRCSAENVKGFPFWVRSETADKWLDYYSPYGQNGVYFQPKVRQ